MLQCIPENWTVNKILSLIEIFVKIVQTIFTIITIIFLQKYIQKCIILIFVLSITPISLNDPFIKLPNPIGRNY